MKEPRFLSMDEVKFLHSLSIEKFGGTMGLRDASGLESAVTHPQNVFAYESGDLFEIAAAYCFHIAQAQAFLDGNKRTAVATALTFLELNGVPAEPRDSSYIHEAMIAIAQKRMTRPELAKLFRQLFGPKRG